MGLLMMHETANDIDHHPLNGEGDAETRPLSDPVFLPCAHQQT